MVQSGQGADEIFAGYDWYPPLADVARDEALDAYAKVFFDRADADAGRRCSSREWLLDTDPPSEFVAAHFGRPGAETASTRRCGIDTQ